MDGGNGAEARHAPDLLEVRQGGFLEGLDQQGMRVVHEHGHAIGMGLQGRGDLGRPRDVAGEMGVGAAAFADPQRQARGRPMAFGQAPTTS